jgi:hypothetical protein
MIGVSRVRGLADSFDENPAAIVEAQPRSEPWREAAGLGDRLDDSATESHFNRLPNRARHGFPVDANTRRRRRIR